MSLCVDDRLVRRSFDLRTRRSSAQSVPFIVIIETISNLIRPGTLAVRLTANIIARHLLLTLLGNNGPSLRHTLLTILITAHILLLILEAAVAVIQSYVFAILRTLYSREVN